MQKRSIIAAVGIAAALVVTGSTGAVAGKLIGSNDIKNDSVRSIDLKDGTIRRADLAPSLAALIAAASAKPTQAAAAQIPAPGVDGKDGKDGVAGLYYVTATYGADAANNPGVSVNQGAIATVACNDPADYAIAGGAQTLGLGGSPAAVASSFPGRMDWSTNTPKPNRFDGWIVQFNASTAPVKANIWVTCVKADAVPQTVVPIS